MVFSPGEIIKGVLAEEIKRGQKTYQLVDWFFQISTKKKISKLGLRNNSAS